jgi:hypothetical protein
MSWKIVLKNDIVEYSIGNDSFNTDEIQLVESKYFNEPGGYKEPEDTICEEVYSAASEHGVFTWKVRAKKSDFDTFADIEEVYEIITPIQGIESDTPSFDVEHEE